MRRDERASASLTSTPGVVRRQPANSLWTVTQRIESNERELRVQFTRIAQLQAQLDLVVAALRRSPVGLHV